MGVYVTRWFDRWARKLGLSSDALCDAVREMRQGLFEAQLGAGLYKKRVARSGMGKRGGFRTLLATNLGDRWVFVYGFAKNARDNISAEEAMALRRLAGELLSYSTQAISQAREAGELIEVKCHG